MDFETEIPIIAEPEGPDGDILELAAHLPDLVLLASNNIKDFPAVQYVDGIVMFLDIWGFTSLCERHTKLNLGVDILTKTLNDYLGHIENAILKNGGDVIEFAGDALLVVWNTDERREGDAMASALRCAREIQGRCHDWKTESGVSLALKIALAAGSICITYVGCGSSRHYCTSGPAVMDANRTEKQCTRGSIVLSPGAWEICPDRAGLTVEELPAGEVRLISVDKAWADHGGEHGLKESSAHHDTAKSWQSMRQMLDQDTRTRKINLKKVHRSKMRPFIAPPVLSKFDENQSLDYLCEMREVTVVFANLFMDAAHDHAVCLQAVYDKIHTSVAQFQGMINKIFEFDKGTSFLILFGLPGYKHEHEACHAVQCAGQINDVISAMIHVKQISIGVTTGKVFCGVVGHAERHEYTVIGPKVNMAARLMMHYTGKVTCDEVTKKRSRNDSTGYVRVPDIELKGIDNPGAVWEYTGAGNIDNSIPEFGHPLLAYMEEFEMGWRALYRMSFSGPSATSMTSLHQSPRFVVIGGDPGVGKTRMLRALIDSAKGMNISVITCCPCLGHSSTPYHTISSVVLQLLDLQDIGSPQEREHRLQERFEDTELFWHLCLLNDLLGIQIPVTDDIAELSQRDRTQARHALLAYIVCETRGRDSSGTLIAIDDAHHIDQDSWTYLEVLPSKNCMVALGMGEFRRDHEVPLAASRILQARSTIHIKLHGLAPQCMEALLCQLLEMDTVPRELAIMLTSHQPGRINPSWVKQCVYNMLHHGQLELHTQGDKTICRVAKGVRLMELDIPPSLRGCMVAFIDRLPELQRTAVKIISVVATSFTADVFSHLMPNIIKEKINSTIGSLQSAGILMYGRGEGPTAAVATGEKANAVTAAAGSLRFQCVTLQETAYALLLEKQRRKLHEKYATYLELHHNLTRRNAEGFGKGKKIFDKIGKAKSKTDDNSNNVPLVNGEQPLQSIYPQLVMHWKKANNQQKAMTYMIHGAESAVALGYNMQAISFIYQAKKLSPSTAQVEHLDELGTKAAACLLFTKRRRSTSPRGINKFRWRNIATKARNLEQSTSIEEEEEDDVEEELGNGSKTSTSSDASGGSNHQVSERQSRSHTRGAPNMHGVLALQNGSSKMLSSEAAVDSTQTDGTQTRNGGGTAAAIELRASAIKTYRISKYNLYATLAVCIAVWLYVISRWTLELASSPT